MRRLLVAMETFLDFDRDHRSNFCLGKNASSDGSDSCFHTDIDRGDKIDSSPLTMALIAMKQWSHCSHSHSWLHPYNYYFLPDEKSKVSPRLRQSFPAL